MPRGLLDCGREVAVPAGASVQFAFTLSKPAAFGSAVLTADLDPAVFGEVVSASAFSAMGDAAGYVTIDGMHVEVHVWSRLKGLGRVAGQPVVVVNARTQPGAAGHAGAGEGAVDRERCDGRDAERSGRVRG